MFGFIGNSWQTKFFLFLLPSIFTYNLVILFDFIRKFYTILFMELPKQVRDDNMIGAYYIKKALAGASAFFRVS